MGNVRVAIIDTGISEQSPCAKNISESYILNKSGENFSITESITVDYIGHGTAVAHIIYSTNEDVDIISFRTCDYEMSIDEGGLLFLLEYIHNHVNVDIINISLGAIHQFMYQELKEICSKLYRKGVIVVSSFDNNGAFSYPAAFEDVIGVDIKNKYEDKKDIYFTGHGIIDILVPNIYYRTVWQDKKTILRGTSFATAKITGMISQRMFELACPCEKKDLLRLVANKFLDSGSSNALKAPWFEIKKAIIFPVNKESHALLRFRDMINFKIAGVYDERLSGNVGKILFGENIKSYDTINWEDDFDTVVLSCTSELSALTKREYAAEMIKMAMKFNKNIYSFERIVSDYERIFYPEITPDFIPYENYSKLHKVTIPVVGVFGTSSKQGKFSLQLEIKKRLSKQKYNVAHLSTEPAGYLFDADSVFHCGYQSELTLQPAECISILNKMVWEAQLKGKDILITGCQSGTLHYDNSNVENFALNQYAFALGTLPDFYILCVNPHDDLDYIARTIGFINSIDSGKVCAIAVFPVQAVETISGIKYKMSELDDDALLIIKKNMNEIFNMPVYSIGSQLDMDMLCELIISYFAEE